jgi:lipoprotein-anchoring transpeptidase ErfK/SrfK
MHNSLSRRIFLGLTGATLFASQAATANPFYDGEQGDELSGRDQSQFPPAESPVDFSVEPADLSKIPEEFHRQTVPYYDYDEPGTIVVDPYSRHLFHIQEGGFAVRYGVGVGRAGFEWSGAAVVGMKRRWPRWLPPIAMTKRDLKAAVWLNGMPGGPKNPLGARALYLHADGKDTLFRIHGTNEPHSIGKAMSSGCVRMLNEDVAFLFDLVPVGTKVIVRGDGEANTNLSQNI